MTTILHKPSWGGRTGLFHCSAACCHGTRARAV